ncbi:HTH luxR-type domain-containing protein [uncultured Thiomicrorhabdus sp.]
MQLITEKAFTTTLWESTFPKITVHLVENLPTSTQHPILDSKSGEIIWVLCGVEHWQNLIQQAINSGAKVIALTRFAQIDEFKEAFAYGASGYLDALSTSETLQLALKTVQGGGVWLPSPIVNQLITTSANLIPQHQEPDLSELTPKEKEVAKTVATGESNREIALKLNISERTVKSHLTQIYNKLNLRDRMHLMLYIKGKS